jgi:hypothetical protein
VQGFENQAAALVAAAIAAAGSRFSGCCIFHAA